MYEASSSGLLAPIQQWLDDPFVSEIMINQPQQVWVESQGVAICHSIEALSEYHLMTLIQLIANENNQLINESSPILSASLLDGSRIQCVIPPVSVYPILCIRRVIQYAASIDVFSGNQSFMSVENHQEALYQKAFSQQDWSQVVKMAIQLKKTIVISGGTSSGKTTLLNACLSEVSNTDRMITLEDTREIQIPQPNQISLLSLHSDESAACISMQHLVQCSLRLRPDRIIVGEIRGAEILDFLSAAATGHEGCMTTMHAGSPQLALLRMKQLYKLNHVPSMTDQDILDEIYHVVDLIIQVNRLPQGRLITEVVDLS